jgi:hypothetical protein
MESSPSHKSVRPNQFSRCKPIEPRADLFGEPVEKAEQAADV